MAVPAKAKHMKNPVPNTAENMAEARAHWADHCAICHANNGSGNTTIGQNLYPKAPDMRLPDTQNMPDGELYYTIQNGIRLSGMPAWGQPGEKDEDSWKLVHFIRHLPQLTPDEEHEMGRLNPKGPEERQEEQEEEQFLNQEQAGKPAPKPPTHHNH
jgi:mono/diheme cytochrome c family protein